MTKEGARDILAKRIRWAVTWPSEFSEVMDAVEDYAAACVSEAAQPAKTGRLPEVGGKVGYLRMLDGRWFPTHARGVNGDTFWFASVDGDIVTCHLEAEGVTWRHAES